MKFISGIRLHWTAIFVALVVLTVRAGIVGQGEDGWPFGFSDVESWHLPAAIVIPSLLAVLSTAVGPWFPVWPLAAFIAIGYGFARDHTFHAFCQWGILESLSALCLTAAIANRFDRKREVSDDASNSTNPSRALFDSKIHRAGLIAMSLLVLWIWFTSAIAWMGGNYQPAVNHHPVQMIDNWCLLVAASWSIRGATAWWFIAVTLAVTLAQRIGFHPELFHRNGDLGVLLAIASAYGWMSASWMVGKASQDGSSQKRVLFAILAIVSILISILAAYTLLKSQNRGGAVALGFALLTFLIGLILTRRWITCVCLVGVTALGLAFVVPASKLRDRFEAISVSDSGDRGSVDSRFRIYRAGVRMTIDKPWFGVGLGNFEPMMGRYDPDGKRDTSHNNLIGMFAETGVVGGVIYAGLFALTWLFLMRSAKQSVDPWQGLAFAGIASILVAYMVGGMFMTRHTFWLAYLTLGAALATHDPEGPGNLSTTTKVTK